MAIRKIEDDKLNDMLKTYMEGKAKVKEIQDYLKYIEDEILKTYSEHDILSEFEGTESIETPLYDLKMTFKMTKKINEEQFKAWCEETEQDPERIASLKYEYSAKKAQYLTEEQKAELFKYCIQKTRAKTAFDVKMKPQLQEEN